MAHNEEKLQLGVKAILAFIGMMRLANKIDDQTYMRFRNEVNEFVAMSRDEKPWPNSPNTLN